MDSIINEYDFEINLEFYKIKFLRVEKFVEKRKLINDFEFVDGEWQFVIFDFIKRRKVYGILMISKEFDIDYVFCFLLEVFFIDYIQKDKLVIFDGVMDYWFVRIIYQWSI